MSEPSQPNSISFKGLVEIVVKFTEHKLWLAVGGTITTLAAITVVLANTHGLLGPKSGSDDHSIRIGQNQGTLYITNTIPTTSNDPREILQRRGVEWSRTNFDQALNERDWENVQLFITGGMPINRSELSAMTISFDPIVSNVVLSRLAAVEAEACPTEGNDWSFYNPAKNSLERRNFIRRVCGSRNTLAFIEKAIASEKERLDKLHLANSRIAQSVAACVQDLRSYGFNKIADEATNINGLYSVLVFSPRQAVEVKLNAEYIAGRSNPDVESIVKQSCVETNSSQKEDRGNLDGWLMVQRLLT